jgi:predicted acylesterase/phospholipase RssA
MQTQQDLNKNNEQQAEEMVQKELERLKLNKYCADNSIPSDCKAEAIIDFQIRWGVL